MQTFLPYEDFAESAATLDTPRLGKQRVETYQIVLALTGLNPDGSPKQSPTSWANHPVAKMWGADRLHALYDYQFAVCHEWTVVRGYRDTCLDKTWLTIQRYDPNVALACAVGPSLDRPWWLGLEEFHEPMRSNLIRKMPEHYAPQFPDTPPDLPYWYPAHDRVGV